MIQPASLKLRMLRKHYLKFTSKTDKKIKGEITYNVVIETKDGKTFDPMKAEETTKKDPKDKVMK